MTFVFQYGSNASRERLNSRDRLDGTARPVALAMTVEDEYELAFTYNSKGNRCAVADLIHGPRHIYGGLYEIPENRVYRSKKVGGNRTLDEVEGEGNAYERTTIRVRRLDTGDVIEALTYLVIERKAGIQTAPHYVAHIVHGLREFDAPTEYIEYVKARAILSNPSLRSDFVVL